MEKHNPLSVCHFPEDYGDNEISSLKINNLVYEPYPYENTEFVFNSTYICFIILSGKITFETDYSEYKLKRGDIFFTFPNKRFRKKDNENAKYIYISFSNVEAKQLLDSLDIKYASQKIVNLSRGIKFVKEQFSLSTINPSSQIIPKSILFYILSFFAENQKQSPKTKQIEAIEKVMSYLKDHYSEDISLETVCNQLFFSYNYLSQLIKKNTGSTFKKILTDIRIENARKLLKDKNNTVTQVSYMVGYNDVHYFDNVFKKYSGLTPKEYQQNNIDK